MARTINEIYNVIVAEKDNQTELSALQPVGDSASGLTTDLSTGSKVAIWRLWAWVTSVAIWTLEKLYDEFVAEINAKIELTNYGTNLWWIDRMRKYQFGDNLVIVETAGEKSLTYSVINENLQIIDFVAISDSGDGGSIIKVAKDDGFGLPTPLNTAELLGAIAYVDTLQPAGAKLGVISRASDLVKYTIDLYYNPLLDLATITANVELAVVNYHKNLEFNGAVILSKLVDEIQSVDGVFDLVVNSASGKPSGGTYSVFNRKYSTSAGFVTVDPANPLSATITYLPK